MQQNGDIYQNNSDSAKNKNKHKEKILDGPISNNNKTVLVETTISIASGNLSPSSSSATTALSKFLEENNDRNESNKNIKLSTPKINLSCKSPVQEQMTNSDERGDRRITYTNENNGNNVREDQQENDQYVDVERADKEFRTQVYFVHTVICILCFLIGRYGFSVVLIWIFISQFNSWYNSRTRDTKQRVAWYIQRELGNEKLRRGDGETVEWLNYIVQQIWITFNPELLVSITDMLEDAMNRSAPYFVAAAVVENLELGIVAPRIDNITILGQREDEGGNEILIGEASFSFLSSANNASAVKVSPPHIIASIKTGLKAYIPIKLEIIGFSGTIRFEIQAIGSPPFVSRGKFSFVKTPTYETSIVSLLPILKDFLKSSVNTTLQTLTYPNATEVDLAELLSGDDFKHDTTSIGIVKIDIYEAKNLAKEDLTGNNDPYVVTSLDPSPYIHSEITTRIIENDAHPIWHEQHFHKIPELDVLSEHVKLKLGVWDWDRFSPDDHIGSAWFDLINAIGDGKEEMLIFDGWTDLYLTHEQRTKRGSLRCRILYTPKLPKDVVPEHDQTSRHFYVTLELNISHTHSHTTEYSSTKPPSWSDVVLFPIFERYKRCLSFKIKRHNFLGVAKTVGIAEIWLRDLLDLEEETISLPIYEKSLTAHQRLIAQQESLSDSNQQRSPKIKGYLQFNIKFLPGLSPLHEKMLRRTLTGANARVLEHSPAHDIDLNQEIRNSNCRYDPDLVPERRHIHETEVPEDRRINQFYQSQTIRRIQWFNDLIRVRLSHFIGRHEWSEDLQVVEREA
ncbi:637_t:CDS:10 [Ambispora leptoticha]|uniref:637_t:CDS:1 n=1 Tax=Ambispora leptoticha TaxID=144679 RepID=A0A9N9FGH0_9GLOM|nr:637_t:CDS:10 [Ambispora leptoticha]